MSSTLTIGGKTVQDITIGAKQVKSIYDNTHQVLLWERIAYFRITNTSDTGGVFTITRVESPTTADLKYSLDGVNWTTADLTADFSLSVSAGANLYLKGTNTSGFNGGYTDYYKMTMDVNHSIGGNIMSIVDETNYTTITSIPKYCFTYLFNGDTHLVNAGDVNFGSVTSIGGGGCQNMYQKCTSLTTPSDLSNITSISWSGCQNMYMGCSALTTGSDLSNITSIGDRGCKYMYGDCKSLSTPSDLSNVTSVGSEGCNSMYEGCTSLTTATAPNISEWDTTFMENWLGRTASTGVVRKPANLSIPTDSTSGVPTGWTTEDY